MKETNHTFFKFMNDLIDSEVWAKLSAAARALYPVLCRFSDETFKCVWPGTEELLRLTGFQTKRSLQQAKKELVEKGLLDIVPGSGRTSSRYYFRFDYIQSKINLEEYRSTVVSRRGIHKEAPERYTPAIQRDTPLSPNQIHINIHQNNDKQERLLQNMQNLLQQFLSNLPQNTAENYKQHITSQMLNKYGQLEVGEAIRIAISKGKDGDIRYLEGILKNRQNENSTSKPSPKNKNFFQSEAEREKNRIKNNLSENWHDLVEGLEFRFSDNGVTYFCHKDDSVAAALEEEAQKNGIALRIFPSSA